jgi:hypothetical protein
MSGFTGFAYGVLGGSLSGSIYYYATVVRVRAIERDAQEMRFRIIDLTPDSGEG